MALLSTVFHATNTAALLWMMWHDKSGAAPIYVLSWIGLIGVAFTTALNQRKQS